MAILQRVLLAKRKHDNTIATLDSQHELKFEALRVEALRNKWQYSEDIVQEVRETQSKFK